MTVPASEDEFPAVCQFLGLADDADSHATYATEAHRCYRLEHPTRIATNHQESFCLGSNHATCPVFLGQGVAGAAPGAAAAATRTGTRPAPQQAPRSGQGPRGQQGRPAERTLRPSRGTVGPRPRPGGISIPVLTIGLFALAAIVILLALWIQSLVGGDNQGALNPADVQATQQANRTTTLAPTQPANQTARPAGTGTVAGGASTGTPAANRTPGATTTGTAGATAATYKVVPGDTCGGIAEAHNVAVADIIRLNTGVNADCTNLKPDQELKLR